MLSLIEAALDPGYPAEIALVLSNVENAAGLDKARAHGIDAIALPHKDYKSRRRFDERLHAALLSADIELICCAGFMRILSPHFVAKWPRKILNIHPSLLPKYKGLNTHERVLDSGDTIHGCTVHFVDEELDNGDTILQETIKVENDDSAESLASRLLPVENALYPRALRLVIETF